MPASMPTGRAGPVAFGEAAGGCRQPQWPQQYCRRWWTSLASGLAAQPMRSSAVIAVASWWQAAALP
ncbi:MAG: hypothetical protein HOQ10_10775 [Frateuria sp.]|uniref:hypothetical protein n=1 Tax=Frateuria sp. TaxID=2211372 RepID=UPI001791B1A3|nr:hypothetical protein [Frateuria sp.]NUO73186.1 hypothetical protein [Frateuria sp.]NUR23702.1 hypothetical protein [Frateuria sp.]